MFVLVYVCFGLVAVILYYYNKRLQEKTNKSPSLMKECIYGSEYVISLLFNFSRLLWK